MGNPEEFTVELRDWYSRGNPYYKARDYPLDGGPGGLYYKAYLLDEDGGRCCLGFFCAQAGVEDDALFEKECPSDLAGPLPDVLDPKKGRLDPPFVDVAIALNDRSGIHYMGQSWPLRVRQLVTLFLGAGIEMKFTLDGKPFDLLQTHVFSEHGK